LLQRLDHPFIGIKGLIGNDRVRINAGQQGIGSVKVMRLSRGEMNARKDLFLCIDYCCVLSLWPNMALAIGPLAPLAAAEGPHSAVRGLAMSFVQDPAGNRHSQSRTTFVIARR